MVFSSVDVTAHLQGCKNVGWTQGERGARAYNGGVGSDSPTGSRDRAPDEGAKCPDFHQSLEQPLAKRFMPLSHL